MSRARGFLVQRTMLPSIYDQKGRLGERSQQSSKTKRTKRQPRKLLDLQINKRKIKVPKKRKQKRERR